MPPLVRLAKRFNLRFFTTFDIPGHDTTRNAHQRFGRVSLIVTVCMLAGPGAHAQTGQAPSDSASRNRPGTEGNAPAPTVESTMPQTGVLHPIPDASVDNTITPPNVDPKMQIPPPVTQGSGVKVEPK